MARHFPFYCLAAAMLVLWACALVSVVRNRQIDTGTRWLWIAVITLAWVTGPVLYFLFAPRTRPLFRTFRMFFGPDR